MHLSESQRVCEDIKQANSSKLNGPQSRSLSLSLSLFLCGQDNSSSMFTRIALHDAHVTRSISCPNTEATLAV